MGRRYNSGLCTGISGQLSIENYVLLNKLADQAKKIGDYLGIAKNYTREELLDGIRNVTEESTRISTYIGNKKIKMSVLGDELFEKYLGVGKNVVALQFEDRIYIRRSSKSILSDIVHEGMHAYEFKNGKTQEEVSSRSGEIIAYVAERKFQKKKYGITTFSSDEEIVSFVNKNYK
jgi:hypothetical protein